MTKKLIRFQQAMVSDRGQGAVEYIGILAIVAVVIGLVIAAFNAAGGQINAGVVALITAVVGGGG